MATIRARGDYQYQARIQRVGFPVQTKTFATREEAEVWAAEVELSQKKGTFVCNKEAQKTTVAAALRKYLKEVTPHKKGSKEEAGKIGLLLREPFVQLPLTELSGHVLKTWADEQAARGYAANTIRLKLAIVSNLYTVARKLWGMGHLDNPVQAMRMPKVRNARENRILPEDEARLLAMADPVMQRVITLGIETGMRRSEMLGLYWQDVYEDRIRLRETKNGSPRVVPLSSRARASLSPRAEGKVFPLHPDTISHRFQELCQQVGLTGLRFHDLRHEAVSRFFERGLSMMEVMSISGHKTTSQLLRYTHLQSSSLAAKLG